MKRLSDLYTLEELEAALKILEIYDGACETLGVAATFEGVTTFVKEQIEEKG